MRSLSHLNKYFYKYRWRLLLGVFFIVIQNIFYVYGPLIVKEATNFLKEAVARNQTFIAGEANELSPPELISTLFEALGISMPSSDFNTSEDLLSYIGWISIALLTLYMAIALIKGFFLFLTRQTIIVMSRLIEYDLKNEIYDQYQRLSMSFYKRNNTGDLMNRISEDVSKVRMYMGPAIMYTINLAVLSVFSIWAMAHLNPKLTLYVLLPLPLMSILIYHVSQVMNKRSEAVQRQQSALSTFVQENFSGIRVMKAYGREEDKSNVFQKESDLYRDLVIDQVKIDALFMPTIILLIGISTLLAIFLGARMIINGTEGFTYGDLVAFVFYVNMLTWPFASVGWVTSLVQRAAASQERINEFLRESPEVVDGGKTIDVVRGDIQFKSVSFTYPESGIQALNNVSFTLTPGKTLGVFGRTGSGKSTLTALLTRQFDPQKGSIYLDGIDIKELDLRSLRKDFGYVPQEVFLFSDSIANNIAFGIEEKVDRTRIEQAGEEAEMASEIEHLPKGYDTLLGEWGINLSGGQKQRVSLARAIIRRPKVLIFDDSLSAVDTETEENILQTLDKIIKQRSTILISHRISTIRRSDHIIVLEDGRIVAQGTHDELVGTNGFYAQMDHRQSIEVSG